MLLFPPKLLGELLLDRHNFTVMTRYISKPENLKLMMNLLRDKSPNIQFEAFHVFKVRTFRGTMFTFRVWQTAYLVLCCLGLCCWVVLLYRVVLLCSVMLGFTFTFRAFSRRFLPKSLTIGLLLT